MSIRLDPMTAVEYAAYFDNSIREYAEDKIKAGNWTSEEALERSRREFESLLPQGIATPDNYLFTVRDTTNDVAVGIIWFGVMKRPTRSNAFIYDVLIYPQYQRRGFGRAAMLAVEDKVRALGLDILSLHVFGYNTGARALYESLGYEITNINMSKKL
jgi:ribosomal protein S18 acetylase RimI-like enzyme